MSEFNYKDILAQSDSKIVLLVLDGLGGLPQTPDGMTELESAATPNLDRLAREGLCGLHEPIHAGVTPGSGPSHLALFGYDPVKYQVGRGVLSALGIDYDLNYSDVAARGNFCTLDDNHRVTDRRADRISTDVNRQLCEVLNEITLDAIDLDVRTVSEHRFLLVLKGDDLDGHIADTDPQVTGKEPLKAMALSEGAEKSAHLVDSFIEKAEERLREYSPANGVLMRGFAQRPSWPTMTERFGVTPLAIASYPMYRGVAKLIGMDTRHGGDSISDEIKVLHDAWADYDFFYVHFKKSDSAGEDGDFERKVAVIEAVDEAIPRVMELNPDVIIATGDHSTPAVMKSHSWHPVPVLIWSRMCRPDSVRDFGEQACTMGGLGARIDATSLMPIALANAGRMKKYGA